MYGTARNTAREAIRILSDAGLVITDHGRGSFVRPAMTLIRLGNDRYSPKHRETGLSPFLLECAKQGKTGRFEVLSIDRVQPRKTWPTGSTSPAALSRCCVARMCSAQTMTRSTG
jgi:GntR family transcriptional regulator